MHNNSLHNPKEIMLMQQNLPLHKKNKTTQIDNKLTNKNNNEKNLNDKKQDNNKNINSIKINVNK